MMTGTMRNVIAVVVIFFFLFQKLRSNNTSSKQTTHTSKLRSNQHVPLYLFIANREVLVPLFLSLPLIQRGQFFKRCKRCIFDKPFLRNACYTKKSSSNRLTSFPHRGSISYRLPQRTWRKQLPVIQLGNRADWLSGCESLSAHSKLIYIGGLPIREMFPPCSWALSSGSSARFCYPGISLTSHTSNKCSRKNSISHHIPLASGYFYF